MTQQQNQQQQDNSLQKKAEQALSATFAMPPIRTMADDLLEASKSVNVPVYSGTSVASPTTKPVQAATTTPQNKIPVPPSSTSSSAVQGKPLENMRPPLLVKQPQQGQPVNNIVLPAVPVPEKKTSILPSILLGVGVAIILCIAVLAGYIFWPKKTNTIADKIPAETIAFISVKRGSNALDQVFLPKLAAGMGVTENVLGDNWQNIVYGLLPGSSSSEPVRYVMTDSASSVNTASATGLTSKKLSDNYVIIVEKDFSGRLDGLSGKGLGSKTDYVSLLKQITSSQEFIYIKDGEAGSIIGAMSFMPANVSYPVLMAVSYSAEIGKKVAFVGVSSNGQKFIKNQIDWSAMLKAVPADVISASGSSELSARLDKWRLGQSGNAQMQGLLNTLSSQGETIQELKSQLTGSYVTGSISSASLKPDGIAVLGIKDGMADLVKQNMAKLEESFRKLGPLVGGAPFQDVMFADGNYKNMPIRFVNFGDSNHSFDYVVTDSIVMIATSKGGMQKLIDTYNGDAVDFSATFTEQSTGQDGWQFMRLDGKVLEQLSPAWKLFVEGFVSMYSEPVKDGIVTGNIAY